MRTVHVPMLFSSLCLGVLGVVGCKDLTGSTTLPAGTPDPSTYNNKAGAIGMRNAAIFQVELALRQYVIDAGLLSDELQDHQIGASPGALLQLGPAVTDPLDERILPAGVTVASYGQLQGARTVITQARAALAAYDTAQVDTTSAKDLRGELYALEGYTDVMLADLFCSGIPLTTLDFQKDFTYAPASTTEQVYRTAIAKLDTAILLTKSDSILRLAYVGLGRSYLDLGDYAAAADDVATVPDSFTYQLAINWAPNSGVPTFLNTYATVSDSEGRNGLPFLSSRDPRTAVDTVFSADPSNGGPFVPLTFPTKYQASLGGSGFAPFTLASGIEARLIQAEAALNGVATGRGSWIGQLNSLRTAAGLSTIADPGGGDPTAQIDTLFTERAYWLFLDGHRQGDLRRLLRQYNRYSAFESQERVYPTGRYTAPGTGTYGSDIVAPIPPAEAANPNFHGCLSYAP